PKEEPPAPPKLLMVNSAGAISWQGSVSASDYNVERALKQDGPWSSIATGSDDASMPYRPLLIDPDALPGHSYFYRVLAHNHAGTSAPSNVLGPVRISANVLVDELRDLTHLSGREGELTLVSANARAYKEDPHRLKGTVGSSITYRSEKPAK